MSIGLEGRMKYSRRHAGARLAVSVEVPKPKATATHKDLRVLWKPNLGAQTRLITCPYNEILYGGAKGGGKSDGICGDWLGHQARNPKWARGVIFRKDYPSLEQLIERGHQIFQPLGARWFAQKRTWVFPGGARLKVRFIDSAGDARKYQGHEYTWIAFDEVGDVADEQIINELRGALRTSKPVTERRLLLCGNPLGLGHAWLKARFISGMLPEIPIFESMKLPNGQTVTWSRVFIPARIEDNPPLLEQDPGYLLRLEQMCLGRPGLLRALRYGDWTAELEVVGALLTMETISKNRVGKETLPLMLPQLEQIWVGLDPSGSGKPGADEAGIVVVGRGYDRHKYLLADESVRGGPDVWANRTDMAVKQWHAQGVVVETNFGGEMARGTLKSWNPELHVEEIHVSKGKDIRAAPVAVEYIGGWVHHVGHFPKYEGEWVTWVPGAGKRSPNRLDAGVFAIHRCGGAPGLNIRDL